MKRVSSFFLGCWWFCWILIFMHKMIFFLFFFIVLLHLLLVSLWNRSFLSSPNFCCISWVLVNIFWTAEVALFMSIGSWKLWHLTCSDYYYYKVIYASVSKIWKYFNLLIQRRVWLQIVLNGEKGFKSLLILRIIQFIGNWWKINGYFRCYYVVFMTVVLCLWRSLKQIFSHELL